jgi:hypothetical protein
VTLRPGSAAARRVQRGAAGASPPYPEGMGTDEHVCPECGQPVATAVRRYKTLGVWVPHWGPGPCRNPECKEYVGESTAQPPGAHAVHHTGGSDGAHGKDGAPGERATETS